MAHRSDFIAFNRPMPLSDSRRMRASRRIRQGISVLLSLSVLIFGQAVSPRPAEAAVGAAFVCAPAFYQSSTSGATPAKVLLSYNVSNNTFGNVGSSNTATVNPLAWNPADNYLYGINGSTLYKIDAGGVFTPYTNAISMTTGTLTSGAGDFWGNNTFLSAPTSGSTWTKITIPSGDPATAPAPVGVPFNLHSATSSAVNLSTISAAGRAGSLVTITTSAAHGLLAGDIVTINLASGPTGYAAAFNATNVEILTRPSTTTFTYLSPGGSGTITSAAATGTITGTKYTAAATAWGAFDLTVLGDIGYGLNNSTLYIVNLNTHVLTTKSVTFTTSSGGALTAPTTAYGAAYSDLAGDLFFFANTGSKMFTIPASQVPLSAPVVRAVFDTGSTPTLTAPNDGASCPNAASPFAPTVNSSSASSVTSGGATFNANVTANNASTTTAFCYGTGSSSTNGVLSGCTTTSNSSTTLTGAVATNVNAVSITGLLPGTTYYWQAVATNTVSGYGTIQSFTTTGPPIVTTTAAGSVASTTATLNGTVNPGYLSTAVTFCYGTDPGLSGCTTTTATQSPLAAGSITPTAVSKGLTGLSPGFGFRIF